MAKYSLGRFPSPPDIPNPVCSPGVSVGPVAVETDLHQLEHIGLLTRRTKWVTWPWAQDRGLILLEHYQEMCSQLCWLASWNCAMAFVRAGLNHASSLCDPQVASTGGFIALANRAHFFVSFQKSRSDSFSVNKEGITDMFTSLEFSFLWMQFGQILGKMLCISNSSFFFNPHSFFLHGQDI